MISKSFDQMQQEFMDLCGQPRFNLADSMQNLERGINANQILLQQLTLWANLINEEVNHELFTNIKELLDGLTKRPETITEHIVNVSDDIADSIYVLCGLANCIGIPLRLVYNEVHRSNMAKAVIGADGNKQVKRRADGKILKPEGWQPPDIKGVLQKFLDTEEKEVIDFVEPLMAAKAYLSYSEVSQHVYDKKYDKALDNIDRAISQLSLAKTEITKLMNNDPYRNTR